MKRERKRKTYWILRGVLPLLILLPFIKPEATFLILFGNRYKRCEKIPVFTGKSLSDNQKDQDVYIYKAQDKPFILVGPYTFSPGDQDFFFVNKNQVIRTATDKGGGEFFQLASWLFVIDDMSGPLQNRIRAPWWDELKSKKASVKKENDRYIYTLFLEDVKKFATFAIPERVFSPDMTATNTAF